MEVFKDIVLNVDVNTKQRECEQTNQEFWSYDQGAARIIINLTKNHQPIETSSVKKVRLFMASSDRYGRIVKGMQYQTDIELISGGQAVHVLPFENLYFSGRVVIYVYIMFADGPKNDSGQSFLIDFRRSAIDGSEAVNVMPLYFQSFDDILSIVQIAADKKMEELNKLGVDVEGLVNDYLAKYGDIATKEYVDQNAKVTDALLASWLRLESEEVDKNV